MAPHPGSTASVRRHENLALAFQEILVGSVRLLSGITDCLKAELRCQIPVQILN